jgi:hypothetical protein
METADFFAYSFSPFAYIVQDMKYEYKSISLTPDGIRVKGDDVTEKLASMIDKECAFYSKDGWKLVSMIPSLKSEGAVVRLLLTFERECP